MLESSSVVAGNVGGQLQVQGGAGDDHIWVVASQDADISQGGEEGEVMIHIISDTANVDLGGDTITTFPDLYGRTRNLCERENDEAFVGIYSVECYARFISSILIHGGAGNDQIKLYLDEVPSWGVYSLPYGASVYGDAGSDVLKASNAAGAYLDGGTENDFLYGGAQGDTLVGGAGNDYFHPAGGNDSISGGADYDEVDYSDSGNQIDISQNNAADDADGSGGTDNVASDVEQVDGTKFNDTLRGGSDPSIDYYLFGNLGDDTFFSGAGRDHFNGGGNGTTGDFVNYWDWNTPVTAAINGAGPGGDTIAADIEGVRGTRFADFLIGNGGGDTLIGEGGNDTFGASGRGDRIYGDAEPNGTLHGSAGPNDIIDYYLLSSIPVGTSLTSLPGGDSNPPADVEGLAGTNNADVLRGSTRGGTEYLYGLDGDDDIEPSPTHSATGVDAGNGTDAVSYAGWGGPLSLYLFNYANTEILVGTQASGDVLESSGGSLVGLGGDDRFQDDGGPTRIYGDNAPFSILDVPAATSNGFDTADYSHIAFAITATVGGATSNGGALGSDVERVIGTQGNDTLNGDGGANWLYGNGGDDHIYGNGGDDHLYGDESPNNIDVPLTGADGSDYLSGGPGNDDLTGGAGNDELHGDADNDHLHADPGNDILDPGSSSGTGVDEIDFRSFPAGCDITITPGDPGYDTGCGGGNDAVEKSTGGKLVIDGSAGKNTFVKDGSLAGNAAYEFDGGASDDTFIDRGNTVSGPDFFSGGGGNDSLQYQTTTAVTMNLRGDPGAGGPATGDRVLKLISGSNVLSDVEQLWGGSAGDVLTGSDGSDLLVGANGNDTLYGMGGADTLDGGAGDDSVYGADSHEEATFPTGHGDADYLFGGLGNDHLYGENGPDTLWGGLGADYLNGGVYDNAVDTLFAAGDNQEFTEFNGTVSLPFVGPAVADTVVCGHGILGTSQDVATWDPADITQNCVAYAPGLPNTGLADPQRWLPPSEPGRARITFTDVYNLLINSSDDWDSQVEEYLQKAIIDAGADAACGEEAGPICAAIIEEIKHLVDDNLRVTEDTTSITFVDENGGLDPGNGCRQGTTNGRLDRHIVICPTPAVPHSFNVTTHDGNDQISSNVAAPGTFTLNGGNDTVMDPAGTQTINGGTGINTMMFNRPAGTFVTATLPAWNAPSGTTASSATTTGNGQAGENDTIANIQRLVGGPENDTFQGTTASETFDGGGGFNTMSYSDRTATQAVNVTLPGTNATTTANGQPGENDSLTNFNAVYGGAGNDTLTGSAGDDLIRGGYGTNTLDGSGGSNTLDAADVIQGMTVNIPENGVASTFTFGTGRDNFVNFVNFNGGSGPDVVHGSSVANVIHGGPGNDTLFGGAGNDAIYGDANDDYVDGQTGGDVMDGGTGNNIISYIYRTSAVNVGFNDGANDGETINGVSEGDDVRASGGVDSVYGTAFNDTFEPTNGVQKIFGLAGYDTVTYNTTLGMTLNVGGTQHYGPAEGDFINSDIEELRGGSGNDTFMGSPGTQKLDGRGGTNTISYDDHQDATKAVSITLPDGDATTTGNGWAGENDTLVHFDNALGGWGNDTIHGNANTNFLYGNFGNDRLYGAGGNEFFIEEPGADEYHGEGGTDTMTYVNSATAVNVTLDNAANDGAAGEQDNVSDDIEVVNGSPYGDSITGSAHADTIYGGDGGDTLVGLGGADVLNGGTGNDHVYGDGGPTATRSAYGVQLLPAGQVYGGNNIDAGTGTDYIDTANGAPDTVACGEDASGTDQDYWYYDLSQYVKDANPAGDCETGRRVGWSDREDNTNDNLVRRIGVASPGNAATTATGITAMIVDSGYDGSLWLRLYQDKTLLLTTDTGGYADPGETPAIAFAGGLTIVAARGGGHDIWTNACGLGCKPNSWVDIGKPPVPGIPSSPSIARFSDSSPAYAVFVRGGDGALWARIHNSAATGGAIDGHWSAWISAGGQIAMNPFNEPSSPAALFAGKDGEIKVYVRGTTNHIYSNSLVCPLTCAFTGFVDESPSGAPAEYDESTIPPTYDVQGSFTGTPTVVTNGDGWITLFARDDVFYSTIFEHIYVPGVGWYAPWNQVGDGPGLITAEPAAASTSYATIQLYMSVDEDLHMREYEFNPHDAGSR